MYGEGKIYSKIKTRFAAAGILLSLCGTKQSVPLNSFQLSQEKKTNYVYFLHPTYQKHQVCGYPSLPFGPEVN